MPDYIFFSLEKFPPETFFVSNFLFKRNSTPLKSGLLHSLTRDVCLREKKKNKKAKIWLTNDIFQELTFLQVSRLMRI